VIATYAAFRFDDAICEELRRARVSEFLLARGLRGLSDRVAALDGRLELSSREDEGTTVRARIPCA
jgi:signal transduction histidine kinase